MSYHNDIRSYATGMNYLLIFFLIFCLNVFNSHAAEVTLSPSVSGGIRYDDNISFSRTSREHDIILLVTPGVELSYKTEKTIFETGIKGNLSRYKDYDELDENHYDINLNGTANLSEKFRLNGSVVRSRASTLESELSETGIITQRSDVDRDNLGLGFLYVLSEKSRIALDSSWFRADYESDDNVDYDGSSVSLTFSRIMGSGIDTLFLQPYYSENSSSFSGVKSMGLYLGWARDLSETLSFSAYMGARRSKTEYYIWEQKNWGWLVDLSLDKAGETWNAGLGLTRDLKFSSTGEPVETDKLNVNFRKNISEKYHYSFSGGITSTESTGLGSTRDTMYYSFNNTLSYMIQKDLFLRFSYIYYVNHDSLRSTEKSVDRNRVMISLSYSFQEEL